MNRDVRDLYHFEHIMKYVADHVDHVFKTPNQRFKYPFIDPGSTNYDGNLWDWDSYWTVYALSEYEKLLDDGGVFKAKLIKGAQGNVLNFLSFQLEDGYIPMAVMMREPEQEEGAEPYLIRKHREGAVLNMHKPFLCQQACLVSGLVDSYEWLSEYMEQFRRYFECYDRHYLNTKCGLYVWADDVMIGMDNDPAVFGRPRFSTASVYLNSFMVLELQAMSTLLQQFHLHDEAKQYADKADALLAAIQRECYDPRDRFYYSADIDIQDRSYDWFHKGLGVFWHSLPIKVQTWTGFIPMYARIATREQAESIVRLHITNPATFSSDYGIRSLARDEKMYNTEPTINPSNWLGPIWLIVNYITFRALMNYGYAQEASELCSKTLALLGEDYDKTGTLHEYYHPESGEPIMSPGFMNWNMLAINMYRESL